MLTPRYVHRYMSITRLWPIIHRSQPHIRPFSLLPSIYVPREFDKELKSLISGSFSSADINKFLSNHLNDMSEHDIGNFMLQCGHSRVRINDKYINRILLYFKSSRKPISTTTIARIFYGLNGFASKEVYESLSHVLRQSAGSINPSVFSLAVKGLKNLGAKGVSDEVVELLLDRVVPFPDGDLRSASMILHSLYFIQPESRAANKILTYARNALESHDEAMTLYDIGVALLGIRRFPIGDPLKRSVFRYLVQKLAAERERLRADSATVNPACVTRIITALPTSSLDCGTDPDLLEAFDILSSLLQMPLERPLMGKELSAVFSTLSGNLDRSPNLRTSVFDCATTSIQLRQKISASDLTEILLGMGKCEYSELTSKNFVNCISETLAKTAVSGDFTEDQVQMILCGLGQKRISSTETILDTILPEFLEVYGKWNLPLILDAQHRISSMNWSRRVKSKVHTQVARCIRFIPDEPSTAEVVAFLKAIGTYRTVGFIKDYMKEYVLRLMNAQNEIWFNESELCGVFKNLTDSLWKAPSIWDMLGEIVRRVPSESIIKSTPVMVHGFQSLRFTGDSIHEVISKEDCNPVISYLLMLCNQLEKQESIAMSGTQFSQVLSGFRNFTTRRNEVTQAIDLLLSRACISEPMTVKDLSNCLKSIRNMKINTPSVENIINMLITQNQRIKGVMTSSELLAAVNMLCISEPCESRAKVFILLATLCNEHTSFFSAADISNIFLRLQHLSKCADSQPLVEALGKKLLLCEFISLDDVSKICAGVKNFDSRSPVLSKLMKTTLKKLDDCTDFDFLLTMRCILDLWVHKSKCESAQEVVYYLMSRLRQRICQDPKMVRILIASAQEILESSHPDRQAVLDMFAENVLPFTVSGKSIVVDDATMCLGVDTAGTEVLNNTVAANSMSPDVGFESSNICSVIMRFGNCPSDPSLRESVGILLEKSVPAQWNPTWIALTLASFEKQSHDDIIVRKVLAFLAEAINCCEHPFNSEDALHCIKGLRSKSAVSEVELVIEALGKRNVFASVHSSENLRSVLLTLDEGVCGLVLLQDEEYCCTLLE